MNSAKRKTEISKQDRENIDPLWNIENEQLKTQAQANSRLRQQIVHDHQPQTKQSYADSAVQANIKDKIQVLKDKAVVLAKNLQSQKRKHLELQAIIRHMIFVREQDKKVQATHRDDMNFQNIDNLSKKIKKLEYDLQQMFAKLNDLTSKNIQRKHEIDAYRTQRVIDSGIFVKIEKQIIDQETDYKKLLIEKTKFEQQYNKNLQNYKQMKTDIQKQQFISLSKRSSNQKTATDHQQQQFFINIPQIQHAVKFTQIGYNEPKRKSFIGSKRKFSTIQQLKQNQKQQKQYNVKKIFTQTGVNNADTLLQYLDNIQNINQQLFNQVNKDSDRISQLLKQLGKLKKIKQQKVVKYYEGQPQLTKNQIKMKQAQIIQTQINKVQGSVNKITRSLQQLQKTNELRQIGQVLNVKVDQQYGLQSLQQIFGELEQKLNPILANYIQFKKGLNFDGNQSSRKENSVENGKEQSIQELINRVKRVSQSQKIMIKQDFQRQYQQIRKNQNSKTRTGKKKTTFLRKNQH